MDPNTYPPTQPAEPNQYQASPLPPPVPPLLPQKKSNRTKVALWLMIGPTALFIITLIVAITVPFIVSASQPAIASCAATDSSCSLFGDTPLFQTIANVFVFLSGAIVLLTWVPGMIMGIVLLATKPKPTA